MFGVGDFFFDVRFLYAVAIPRVSIDFLPVVVVVVIVCPLSFSLIRSFSVSPFVKR